MPVVGTAGHVDHGKSALVAALTGRDPDRWTEEKRRGLTIDLGFAWAALPDGSEVSFVDVPGHQRFMKNMLSGIEMIDAALLVVAADAGWKEQSEEHLAVLDLLDVSRGLVAISKADRVDDDTVEEVMVDVRRRLAETSLANAPLLATSVVTGQGLDQLPSLVAEQTAGLAEGNGRSRMWIDRSFAIPGAGTVVTGTLVDGPLHVGDGLALHPDAVPVRIRGLQSHERQASAVDPRRRVAVNLVGISHREVKRGSMLSLPGQWLPTTRLLVEYRMARYAEPFGKGSFHMHMGTGAWPVRFRTLDAGVALVDLPQPLPIAAGDRFILRESGRRLVVAGGRVLDPAPPRPSVAANAAPRLKMALGAGPDEVAQALLELRGTDRVSTLSAHSAGGTVGAATVVDDQALSADHVDRLGERLQQALAAHSLANPLRPGLPLAQVAGRLGVTADIVQVVAAHLEGLRVVEGRISLGDQESAPEDDAIWLAARARLGAGGLDVPPWRALGLERELVYALIGRGALVKVSDEVACLPEQIDLVKDTLRAMPAQFTVSQFRDRAGLSRKLAVPLLEWCDRQELTVRSGDQRSVRRGALSES